MLPAASRGRAVPRWEAGLVALWFVAFTLLAELFPRTGDDWGWATAEGSARLDDFFQSLNGRYGGNLLALALVHGGPFTALFVAAVVCATLVLVLHLADNRTPLGYGLVGTLFLAMPLGVWREGVVWLSGFVNYAVATLFLLVFLALARAEWEGTVRSARLVRLVPVAVAGFVGQLFMEHVTLAICALGALLTLLFRRLRGGWPPLTATWTAASFVGAAVMLVNPAYREAARGGEYMSVQSTTGRGALHALALKAFDTIPTYAVVENVVLNVALALLLGVLVATRPGLRTLPRALVLGGAAGAAVLGWALWATARRHVLPERTSALAGVAALLLLVALLAGLAVVASRRRRWTVAACCAGIVLLAGPLLLVNPVGPRSFYPSYVVLLVVAGALGGEVRGQLPAFRRPALAAPLHLAAAGLLVVMFAVYLSLHRAVDERLDEVRAAAAAGRHEVRITPLPHPYYVHDGDPYWSVLANRFKAYYGVRPDLVVRLEPNPWLVVPGKPRPLPPP